MKLNSVENSNIVYEQKGALGKLLVSTNTVDLVHLELDPETEIAEHKVPQNVIFFVTKGNVEFTVEKVKYRVNENQFIQVESGNLRSTKNCTDSKVKFLVIKY